MASKRPDREQQAIEAVQLYHDTLRLTYDLEQEVAKAAARLQTAKDTQHIAGLHLSRTLRKFGPVQYRGQQYRAAGDVILMEKAPEPQNGLFDDANSVLPD